MFETWIQDTRYALRLLRRSPLFAATAALSLAIGIGANTTIFSVASALLLRPPPGVHDPARLVDVGRTQGGSGFDTVSYPNYQDIRDRVTTLSSLYAYELEPHAMSLGGGDGAERVYGVLASGNYFDVLGSRAVHGRLLRPDDDVSGSRVAVISHDLWERRFDGDPAIVGRSIALNAIPVTIVGVAPRGFQGTTLLRSDVWVPIGATGDIRPPADARLLTSRRSVWLVMGGRLSANATVAQARAELASIGAALEREFPDINRGKSYTAEPSAQLPGRVGIVAGFIGLLMAIVSLVLLIACVNIAGMLLARAAARRREIAVRLAIGAARGRLVRQLLTETAVLFAVGGAAGLVLSKWLTALLLGVLPQLPFPVTLGVTTDWRVVGFAIVVSLAAGVLAGLAPALQASRDDLVPALRSEGLDGGGSRLRLRNAFVVGQIAMSLLLIVVAGLFLRSLGNAARTAPGFDQTNVDVIQVDLSLARYEGVRAAAFMRELVTRTRALPGVVDATAANDLPLDGGRFGLGALTVPGIQPPAGRTDFPADWTVVEPGFFSTLRIPILRGRDFDETDTPQSAPVIIVNNAFAERIWPGQDPVGRQLQLEGGVGNTISQLTIVGVAADARMISLGTAPEPFVFVPMSQQTRVRTALLVRSNGRTVIPDVRALLRQMDPNLPVISAMPLSEVTAIGIVPQRVAASVAGSLGVVGLLLAAIGVYGVTSYAVSRRTREIGIRVALGADRGRVLRLVLRQGLVLAAIGVGIGIAIAAAGTRLLESLLFGVTGLDPMTFGLACVIFAVVTLLASYIPARRATRVSPMAALRND
jgi:predicted permease